ncbi:MAG: DUF5666 domain-containing protein [Pseudomonadota bacterium]
MTPNRVLTLAALAVTCLASACAQNLSAPTAAFAPASPEARAYCLALRGGDDETDAGLGGTGLYGTVTSLNLLALDGQRLYLPDEIRIASVLGETDPATLRLGEVLIVEAVQARDGLCALNAAKFLPIVGQVDELDALAGTLSVLGTTVTLSSKTVIEDTSGNSLAQADVPAGATVAVSGIWSGTRVVASHLRVLPRSQRAFASVTGPLRRGSDGGLVVGSTPLTTAVGIQAGGLIAAVGQLRDGALQVQTLRPELAAAPGARRGSGPDPVADVLSERLQGGTGSGQSGPQAADIREAVESRRAERDDARAQARAAARSAASERARDSDRQPQGGAASSPSRGR